MQAQVLNLLRDLRCETSTAFSLIRHDLAVVRRIAHDVLVLEGGRVVEQGPVGEVLGAPQQGYTRVLLDSTPRHGWRPRSRRLATGSVDSKG